MRSVWQNMNARAAWQNQQAISQQGYISMDRLAQHAQHDIVAPGIQSASIHFEGGSVTLNADGSVVYEGTYSPSAAARQFWEAIARDNPVLLRQANVGLADECGQLKDENRSLAVENSQLRRQVDDLKRKAKVK